MMDSKERILRQINENWGETPQSKLCATILDYLLQFPANQLAHITYGRLRNIISTHYKDSDLLLAKGLQFQRPKDACNYPVTITNVMMR